MCTGVAALLQPSAELARRGGTLSLLGFPLDTSTVSYGDWQVCELTVSHTKVLVNPRA